MTDEKPATEEEFTGDDRPGAYRVELPSFEGPLDLLLHLIKKHELDILDIPIGFISVKYVEYIKKMELLSIDLAAEYLVMAATLAHIKSRSLLPPDPNLADDEDGLTEEEDPRAELIRRLLEYQKYKNAAEQLGVRSVLGRDVFQRGAANEAQTGPAPLAPLSLFKLVDAFEGVLQRAKISEDHQIDFERISVTERIGQISELLREKGRQPFEQLFDGDATRADMIVTFLALLEMTKLRMTHLEQAGPLEPIYVELSVLDEALDEAVAELRGVSRGASLEPGGDAFAETGQDPSGESDPADHDSADNALERPPAPADDALQASLGDVQGGELADPDPGSEEFGSGEFGSEEFGSEEFDSDAADAKVDDHELEPEPVEPDPVEPAPAEPVPIEPEPIEPEPDHLGSVDPDSADWGSGDSEPGEPGAAHPEPADPESDELSGGSEHSETTPGRTTVSVTPAGEQLHDSSGLPAPVEQPAANEEQPAANEEQPATDEVNAEVDAEVDGGTQPPTAQSTAADPATADQESSQAQQQPATGGSAEHQPSAEHQSTDECEPAERQPTDESDRLRTLGEDRPTAIDPE